MPNRPKNPRRQPGRLGARDGHALDGVEHLRQSIIGILTTCPGGRIIRPEYGGRIRDLIDRPVNGGWLADLYFEAALAITRWGPRVRVVRVELFGRSALLGNCAHDTPPNLPQVGQ